MKTRRISRLISDDPFERLSIVNVSLLKNIANFYGIDEQLLDNHLMVRTSDTERVRRIYYLSEQVQSVVEKSVGNINRDSRNEDAVSGTTVKIEMNFHYFSGKISLSSSTWGSEVFRSYGL